MRHVWRFLNGSLVAQIIGGLIVTVVGVVSASVWQAHTGQPVRWLRSVPVNVWWALGGGAVVAVLAMVLMQIRSRRNELPVPLVAVGRRSIFGWREFSVDHAGVTWRLRVPLPPSWEPKGPLGFNVTDAEVVGPPRCLKCGTELEERRTVFGWYRERCVGCGLQVRQRVSFAVLARQAERIARRLLEEEEERRRRPPA